jgi:hypothetical protein
MLGNDADATLWYERAVDSAKRIGHTSLHARALAHQAKWLDDDSLAAEARALAEEHGLQDVLSLLA